MPEALYIGIMSGTSLDGADAVLADFQSGVPREGTETGTEAHLPFRMLRHLHAPFPDALRLDLLALQRSGPDELHRMSMAANALADHYASLLRRLLAEASITPNRIIAIGVHGQTVRHRPDCAYTTQLNAPARLAEQTGIDVVADFRSRDIAAGGHGAPLVPAFHADVFAVTNRHRVIVNIGGMANVTDLPGGGLPVRGWDTGPGNVLLDTWNLRHRRTAFDADGAWAASGKIHAALLEDLLAEPYFFLPPPKSTGRDLFDQHWLDAHLTGFGSLPAEDVQATLVELTANCIADAIARHCSTVDDVIVCGGGAFNPVLMQRIAFCLESKLGHAVPVASSAVAGLPPDQVEALAFAWLARQFKLGLPGNLPAVTGASGPRILGALYPT